jgi:hypothetical protein
MGRVCSTNWGKRNTYGVFGEEVRGKEATRKTKQEMNNIKMEHGDVVWRKYCLN